MPPRGVAQEGFKVHSVKVIGFFDFEIYGFKNFYLLIVVDIEITREDEDTGTDIACTVLHYLFTVRELLYLGLGLVAHFSCERVTKISGCKVS